MAIPESVRDISSGVHRSSARPDSSPVLHLPPYDILTYFWDYRAYFDSDCLLTLPSAGSALIVRFWTGIRDRAAEAWRKHLKHWGSRGALHLKTVCQELNSPFLRCREKDNYQKRLADLLAEICRRSEEPSVVAVDQLALPEELRWLYFVSNWDYWWREFYSIARVRERLKLFARWQCLNFSVCAHPRGRVAVVFSGLVQAK